MMASALLTCGAAQSQAVKFRLPGRSACPSAAPLRTSRLVVRAEEGVQKEEKKGSKVAQVDRSKDTLWFASDQSLGYLDGSLPADYGFDPLGLSDPEGKDGAGFIDPKWLAYSEVIHCRFAMLGVAGMLAPEVLAHLGLIPQTVDEVIWFKTGVIPPAGTYDKYWTDPYSLFFIEVVLVQFAELKRWQDYRHPGSQGKQYFLGLENYFKGSGDPAYPGGPLFNVFGLGDKSEAEMKKLKTNEVKNGRLALISIFGYGAQAVMTGQGPYQNLLDHIADPINNNIIANFGKLGQL